MRSPGPAPLSLRKGLCDPGAGSTPRVGFYTPHSPTSGLEVLLAGASSPTEAAKVEKKRGQAAFLQEASPLLHGERDGDGHNHPAATVTARVKPWRQQGRHTCAGKAGRATGLLQEGIYLDLRVSAQLCTESPPRARPMRVLCT